MKQQITKKGLTEQTVLEVPLIQLCFTVSDLNLAVQDFARLTGAGPWYRVDPLPEGSDRTTYRGDLSPLGADIVLAYSGNTMYELVQPHAGSTSIFTEWVSRFGHGLHHFGYAVEAFDQELEGMKFAGKEPVMTSVTARGARVAMFDGCGPGNALHELIEITDQSRGFYDRLQLEAQARTDATLLFTELKTKADTLSG